MSLQLTQARRTQGFPPLGITWQESCPIAVGPIGRDHNGQIWLLLLLQVKTECKRVLRRRLRTTW